MNRGLACRLLLLLALSASSSSLSSLSTNVLRGKSALQLRGGGLFGRSRPRGGDSADVGEDHDRGDGPGDNLDPKLATTGAKPDLSKSQEFARMLRSGSPKDGTAEPELTPEEFAKRAKEHAAESRDALGEGATQCRVKAALQAIDDDAEKYADFKRHNIVLIGSEHASYAKTGGLADVVDKLSLALAQRGHRVMTVIPMYGNYEGAVATGVQV